MKKKKQVDFELKFMYVCYSGYEKKHIKFLYLRYVFYSCKCLPVKYPLELRNNLNINKYICVYIYI